MTTIPVSVPAPIDNHGTDPVVEAEIAVGVSKSKLDAITQQLDQLVLARMEATVEFTHACRRLAELKREAQQ